MPRYNLRQIRGDWRHGPWQVQEKVHEYGLHVAVNKSDDVAVDVIKKELRITTNDRQEGVKTCNRERSHD
jgi:hypothetical protein